MKHMTRMIPRLTVTLAVAAFIAMVPANGAAQEQDPCEEVEPGCWACENKEFGGEQFHTDHPTGEFDACAKPPDQRHTESLPDDRCHQAHVPCEETEDLEDVDWDLVVEAAHAADSELLRGVMASHHTVLLFNEERGAIQARGCGGVIVAHIPLPHHLRVALTTE